MISIPLLESCTELSPEWKHTETDTQFPVDPGTEVEVTCSGEDRLNSGSSTATCVGGTNFETVGLQPDCSRKTGIKPILHGLIDC